MKKISKKIGIVGYGHVGKAMARFFKKRYEVLIHDPEECLRKNLKCATKAEINECDFAVVAVPTPRGKDGAADLREVEKVVGWLESPIILLKSTVPVGTTDALKKRFNKNIVFSPEYIGESTYWTPGKFQSRVVESEYFIFGGDREGTNSLIDLYMSLAGPTKTYHQTDARTAEMAKYMENTFFASKVTFCYEMATLCEAMGLDFHEVRRLWLLDPRINPMHTGVFVENEAPFGGKCLPKDLDSLIQQAEAVGYDARFLKEIASSNHRLADHRRTRSHSPKKRASKR